MLSVEVQFGSLKKMRRFIHVDNLDPQLESIIKAAAEDQSYQKVIEFLASSTRPPQCDHLGRLYQTIWDRLAFEKDVGLLSVDGRIVVPRAAQKVVLQGLHLGHTGQRKTFLNARQLYYWPGLKRDINNLVSNWPQCVSFLPSKPAPLLQQNVAVRPFQAMSLDLAKQDGFNYLVAVEVEVDHSSGWINVAKLTSLETSSITKHLTSWHYDYGKPERLRTDDGPQFRSEFK